MRRHPQQWFEMFRCVSGHFHVTWERDGKRENISVPLEKLANFLCDHGEVGVSHVALAFIGIQDVRPHPKDLN